MSTFFLTVKKEKVDVVFSVFVLADVQGTVISFVIYTYNVDTYLLVHLLKF